MKRFFLFTLAVSLLFTDCGTSALRQTTVEIDAGRKFQTITGWEATAQAGEHYSPAFEKYKNELLEQAVNDLGINRLRVEIRSSAENPVDHFTRWRNGEITEEQFNDKRYESINDNEDPKAINFNGFQFSELDSAIEKLAIPMKKLLSERGEELFLNLTYVDFEGGQSGFDHYDNAEEYAEFMLAAFQHMKRKHGFVPDAIEIILEPDNTEGWASGARIGQAVAAAATLLRANDFEPAFIVPNTTNAANAPVYIEEIARIPGAMDQISEFAYHRYCCATKTVLTDISRLAEKYGKQTAMLEWIGADQTDLHEDLKIAQVSSWQQYTLAFPNQPDNGSQYYLVDDTDIDNPVVTMGKRTKFLRQYFRYIRPGARRIGAETTSAAFDPLAFVNSDGRVVVVVKADAAGKITIRGLPAGVYGISYATNEQTGEQRQIQAINNELVTNIPSAGVITIFEERPRKLEK